MLLYSIFIQKKTINYLAITTVHPQH